MPWPTPNVIGLPFDARFGRWGGPDDYLYSPTQLPSLAAWFDALDTSTMLSATGTTITDGGAVALWGDKSGNSGVNCLVTGGVASNNASIGAIGALGTGDFTVVVRFSIDAVSLGADASLVHAGNAVGGANLIVKFGTARIQMSKAGIGYTSATSGTNISPFTVYTVTYTRSGTTGTYYLNGVADGTCTDSFDYTANSGVAIGAIVAGTGGKTYQARIYSAALDAAGVLADYNGTVQANCIANVNFALAGKKLANGDTFTATTGGTVTLNSSGATGARIAGERDWYMGTLASRGAYNAAGKYIATDGSDDYYKTAAFPLPQPVTLYAVIEQTTWTSGDYLIDGSASDTLALIQTTTTPQINLSAGSSVAANTDLAVETKALVTIVSNGASSLVSINRLPATTGNAGAGVPNGLTLASKGTAGSYGNARYYEIAVYRAAHDQATRHRFALYAARKWGFAA